jgi:peptidoglycan hydrolase CwlO-like protein
MKMIAVAVVSVIAALAAAGFAWQKTQALERTKLELANAQSQLEKATASIRPLQATVDALSNESAEQKLALGQLRSELTTASAFLEAERSSSLHLQEELAKAKEQLASASRGRAVQPVQRPSVVQPRIVEIRPGPSGSAIGAGVRAR